MTLTTLTVELIRRVYASPNGTPFEVWVVRPDGGEEVRAAGRVADWGQSGDLVVLEGRWEDHPRYGRRFWADAVRPYVPADARGLERWLCRQPGIGPATARKVLAALGLGALDRALEDPSCLDGLGLPTPQREAVVEAARAYREQRDRAGVLAWCYRYGLGPALAEAAWRRWGRDTPGVLGSDPWRLADLRGAGFLTADALAMRLGVSADGPSRLRAALVHALEMVASDDGHVYLPAPELVERAAALLEETARKEGYGRGLEEAMRAGLPDALAGLVAHRRLIAEPPVSPEALSLFLQLRQAGAELAVDGDRLAVRAPSGVLTDDVRQRLARCKHDLLSALRDGGVRVYMPWLYEAERAVERWLASRRDAPGVLDLISAAELADREDVRGPLDETQRAAVVMALAHSASVLTGGPGTGKTTVTRAVLAAFRLAQGDRFKPLLCAPTGRAAKRLAEVTGHPARTIHRLLEYHPDVGFRRNRERPLEGSVLVVDECSMVDVELFAALVDAIPDGMPVLLVGDADQLPPVGPGAPFHAIVREKLLPCTRLARVYRQDAGGWIARSAARVNAGEPPLAGDGEGYRVVVFRRPYAASRADWERLGREVRERMAQAVVDAVQELLALGMDPDGVQVLVPTRRGPLGVEALNARLRPVLNPQGRARGVFSPREGVDFWIGDRVIHLENDYEKGVFNGEMGVVTRVGVPVRVQEKTRGFVVEPADPGALDAVPGLEVEYDDGSGTRRVLYGPRDAARQLDLAYAATVHKAQGCEFPAVVVALGWDSYVLLSRQLLYTAMTRAQKALVILAEDGALAHAVRQASDRERYQRLMV